jgi:hypothetical protein
LFSPLRRLPFVLAAEAAITMAKGKGVKDVSAVVAFLSILLSKGPSFTNYTKERGYENVDKDME